MDDEPVGFRDAVDEETGLFVTRLGWWADLEAKVAWMAGRRCGMMDERRDLMKVSDVRISLIFLSTIAPI